MFNFGRYFIIHSLNKLSLFFKDKLRRLVGVPGIHNQPKSKLGTPEAFRVNFLASLEFSKATGTHPSESRWRNSQKVTL